MQRIKKKSVIAIGAVTAVTLLLGACGSSSSEDTSSAPAASSEAASSAPAASEEASEPAEPAGLEGSLQGKNIAYIQPGAAEYYVRSAEGAVAAVEDLGGTAKVYDSAFDPTKELANVKSAILEGVDGIVLFPLSDASAKAELRLANEAGIPISVLYGYSEENAPNGAGFVQVDFFNYAKALGEAFAKEVPEGPIAIVSGTLGRSEVTAFRDGFVSGFGDESRIVEEIPGDYSRDKAFQATQDIITKHPDLAGLVVGNEDMAVGAVSALGDMASQVKVATQNGSPEGNQFLNDGKFAVTVGASPSQESALAVNFLAQTLGGTPAVEKLCYTPWAINTPGAISSVDWAPTPEVIASALTLPPACSTQ
ncbi:MAG: sugar ABC transporter substrate-binding protein [Candidatus Nanopelagicales bacterium]|nr:sugar ABC transporter substrate-binding protein [Candidatus Nanopelagicales bacterium]MCF8536371.1 sugar ABC transporter substrate-binding protein [Candidatus Nanopelagicales bacterium]MCF8541549.1 sugar ABC transporter substrate-binding protein [Candidatus Nanopelagicales bacterium]